MRKLIGIIVIIVGATWVISPIDPIPDVIPVLGQIDDILAVIIAILSGMSMLRRQNDD